MTARPLGCDCVPGYLCLSCERAADVRGQLEAELAEDERLRPRRPRFVVGFYEVDRLYGGPEEGGWWYDAGELRRLFRVERTSARAYAVASRANRLLDRLQRDLPSTSSLLYGGGRIRARVFPDVAPASYPETRPGYE